MDFFKRSSNHISHFFSKIYLFFRKNIIDQLKERDLLKRILFTLMVMVIFVLIGTITLPGIKVNSSGANDSTSFLGILNTIGGGGLRQFSLVSLGISPFITASLVMTFLQTKLFPPIYRLYQSGPAGRIKINYITYALTFVFAIVQGIVIIQTLLKNTNSSIQISIDPKFNSQWFVWIVLPFILVAGTYFSIFLSEQITNKGVGNGSSMLILAGSIISLPNLFTSAWAFWIQNRIGVELFRGIVYLIAFIIAFILMVFIISFIYQAERRVPIQHTGVGRSKNVKDLTYLPLKLNASGIMPVIFSSMIVAFPLLIVNMVNDFEPSFVTRWMIENFDLKKPIGLTIYAVMTFLITIFLSIQQSKIDKIVEDFNKSSTFIPGVIPGEQTEDYLFSIVLRLSIFSAFYLTILSSSQYVAIIAGSPQQLVIPATSVMIIVTVSIETVQQIEARRKALSLFKNKKSKNIIFDEASENQSILW